MTPKIAVFASGSGSNFQAIIDAIASGNLDAQICGLIASKNNIGAIDKATKASIPHEVIRKADFSDEGFAGCLLDILKKWQPDLVVLAGYLVKVPELVIKTYPGKIINIHPSLLPDYGGKGFYGLNVHQAVINDNRTESGCTVHIVTEQFDEGPILAQRKVSVLENDTPESLAARILIEEHQLLPETIRKILTQRFSNS